MAKGTVAKNNAIKAEKTNQVKEAEPKTNEKASDVLQAAKNAAQDVVCLRKYPVPYCG